MKRTRTETPTGVLLRSSSSRSSSSAKSSGAGAFFAILDVLTTVGDAVAASEASTSVSYTPHHCQRAPFPGPRAEVTTSTRTETLRTPLMFRLGADGAPMGGGRRWALFLTIDGQRMGVDARGTEPDPAHG